MGGCDHWPSGRVVAAAAVAAGMASAVDYLTVAEENDLDNLDDYEAGDSMVSDSSGEEI